MEVRPARAHGGPLRLGLLKASSSRFKRTPLRSHWVTRSNRDFRPAAPKLRSTCAGSDLGWGLTSAEKLAPPSSRRSQASPGQQGKRRAQCLARSPGLRNGVASLKGRAMTLVAGLITPPPRPNRSDSGREIGEDGVTAHGRLVSRKSQSLGACDLRNAALSL